MTELFTSKLPQGPARFLAEALEHALSHGRRTAKDFIRHFPPSAIMTALEGQPALRAALLTELVGMKEKTALRTPAEDAGRLLGNALNEGDCDSDSIVRTFRPDDRVRFLDPKKLWGFLVEGDFWKVSRSKDAAGHKIAQAHLAHLIDRGIAQELVSHADVLEGVSIEMLAEKLPRSELAKALKKALSVGREGAPYTERDLYAAIPSTVLVDHIALPHIMDHVIAPLAAKAAFTEASAEAPAGEPTDAASKRTATATLDELPVGEQAPA